ncbi:hypothetical protein GCM10009827_053460 [Dactylosporangium maewongense]|uniref:Uncharacterized protein n=1 Tax=Dactylosporangium maewongense TaxID=634393 RepID=A0ABP4LS18_9ACTN
MFARAYASDNAVDRATVSAACRVLPTPMTHNTATDSSTTLTPPIASRHRLRVRADACIRCPLLPCVPAEPGCRVHVGGARGAGERFVGAVRLRYCPP